MSLNSSHFSKDVESTKIKTEMKAEMAIKKQSNVIVLRFVELSVLVPDSCNCFLAPPVVLRTIQCQIKPYLLTRVDSMISYRFVQIPIHVFYFQLVLFDESEPSGLSIITLQIPQQFRLTTDHSHRDAGIYL